MSEVILYEGAAPATPPAGGVTLYAKIDKRLYWKDDSGTETPLLPTGAGTGDLLSDGTVPLTANWDVGAFEITMLRAHFDATTGQPFTVASSDKVVGLNADQLDGFSAGDFQPAGSYLVAADIGTTVQAWSAVLDATTAAFLIADADKLDNIEPLADVTDADNVAAAGALMESEFTAVEGFMRKTGAGTYEAIKSNLTAIVPPTINDDSNAGYSVGSIWYDTVGPLVYFCLDATAGAAVWISGGSGGMAVTDVKTANYTADSNEVVPVDSSGGAFTVTLPAAPLAQERVIVMDVGKACGTFFVTIARNGNTLDGLAEDFVIDQSHGRVDAVFDGVSDWRLHLIGTPEVVNVNSFATGFDGVNAQIGTTYQFVENDLVNLVTANNGAASTYDIADGFAQVGETLHVLNIGAGDVTITVAGADTLASTNNTVPQGNAVTIVKHAAGAWWVIGGAS